MKKKLAFGFGALVPLIILAASAPVIQWYSQQPTASAIHTNDIFSLERKSPHEYMSIDFIGLANQLSVFVTNSQGVITTTNIYATTINVTSNLYSSTSYLTNLYVTELFALTSSVANLTVTNGITNLSLTANTVLEADSNKQISSIPNGGGVMTNDGSGVIGYVQPIDIEFTGAGAITNLAGSLLTVTIPGDGASILSLSNNLTTTINSDINTASNNIVAQVATNTVYYTNLSTMAPDFNKGYAAITTNSSFTFLLPINLDASKTKVQTAVVRVDNSTGPTPIAVTAPANVHVVPGSVMWITNSTYFTFSYYSPDQTNCYAVPIY